MRLQAYKMSKHGILAMSLFILTAGVFLLQMQHHLPEPLRRIGDTDISLLLIMAFPLGLVGLPTTVTPWRGAMQPFGVAFTVLTLALNSYLWAYIFFRVVRIFRMGKTEEREPTSAGDVATRAVPEK